MRFLKWIGDHWFIGVDQNQAIFCRVNQSSTRFNNGKSIIIGQHSTDDLSTKTIYVPGYSTSG